jgi:tetratricopeptide (TPR) repeat protein
MSHGDFTSFVTGARTFHLDPPRDVPAGWTREVAFRGYQLVCTAVLDFFAAKLRNDNSGQQRLAKDLSDAIIASSAFKPGAPLVPSADEFLSLIEREGVDAAVHLVNKIQLETPGEAVVDERVLNQAGYSFIADKHFEDAARILEFVARIYPQSANAADSLGDAYLAAGQKENALAAFRRAVELLPLDRTLTEAGKTAIESDAKAKIRTQAIQ